MEKIEELISDFKEKIRYSISKGQYSEATELIDSCAALFYGTNQNYIDDELEDIDGANWNIVIFMSLMAACVRHIQSQSVGRGTKVDCIQN